MNNYNFENRNYNRRSYSVLEWIVAFFAVLFDMVKENTRVKLAIKMGVVTFVAVIFFGLFGGVETGVISAALGLPICAVIALVGIIFCKEK